MNDKPVASSADGTGPEATESDTPSVVPNRRERRGQGHKTEQISKIPGHPHNSNVAKQRQFNNRRGG
ncbi:MAG TPA: hypothetical protein VGP03_03570 [Pseudonocardiaceae bacterium]|jgi:hypothetical protein|nr:hypothetical protein [Pseudonocardiaceae bacterium]